MNQKAPKWFVFLMAALSEAYSQEASMMKIDVYWRTLHDIPQTEMEAAVFSVIRGRGTATFPKVAEIRQAVFGNPEDKVILAINQIEQTISSSGRGHSVVFDDPYIHVVITRLGGWPAVCQAADDPDEWKWYKKDMEKLYKAVSQMHLSRLDIPTRLAGTHEINNSANGYAFDVGSAKCPLSRVGDTAKIQLWQAQISGLDSKVAGLIGGIFPQDTKMIFFNNL